MLAIGFLIEAKQIFEQLINQYPENDGLNIPLAEIAIEDNEIDLALNTWKKWIRKVITIRKAYWR